MNSKRITVFCWTATTRKGVVAQGTSKDEVNALRCAKEALARRGLKRAKVELTTRRVRRSASV